VRLHRDRLPGERPGDLLHQLGFVRVAVAHAHPVVRCERLVDSIELEQHARLVDQRLRCVLGRLAVAVLRRVALDRLVDVDRREQLALAAELVRPVEAFVHALNLHRKRSLHPAVSRPDG
jgi:hypothetical protein